MEAPEALATGAGRDFERDGLSDGQRERSSGHFRFPTVSLGPFRCLTGRSRSLPVRRVAVQINSAEVTFATAEDYGRCSSPATPAYRPRVGFVKAAATTIYGPTRS